MNNQLNADPIPGFDPNSGTPRLTQQSARLRLVNGAQNDQDFSLNQITVLVGRNDPPAVQVDLDLTGYELDQTPMVSRRHAELQWVEGDLQVIDLGSKNGTFVDDVQLIAQPGQPSSPMKLHTGSKIRFANIEMEVVDHGG